MLKPKKGLWSQPWSPALIRPEIARLVARPILVLAFANDYGGGTIEMARKRLVTVNGNTAWVDTPYGPGMTFLNPVSSAPTDSLTFAASAYPASNAATVPHSIALLCSPANTSNNHNPFCTGTGGDGVGFVSGGGSQFQVVHYGVVAFSTIGTIVANHWFLELYSYDQVTMNHMVVNLNNGAIASQSVAETRALTTASNGPHVGIKGNNECLQGKVAGLAWVRGAWTINEMEILQRNPTAIWTPVPRRRIFKSSVTVNMFSYAMAGGLQSGGASTVAVRKVVVSAGGLQSGGAFVASVRKVVAPAGGLQSGGAATSSARNTIVGAGGLQSGGAATLSKRKVTIAAGGLNSGGAAGAPSIRQFLASGGLQTGGAITFAIRYAVGPQGGLNSGGVAAVSFKGTQVYAMDGGLQSGGSAPTSRRMVARSPVGGVQSGGQAGAAEVWAFAPSGGLTAAGAALLSARFALRMTGGLQAAGAATTQYIFGGTIAAAFFGRVIIFPELDGRAVIGPEVDGRVTIAAELSGRAVVTPG